MGSGVCSVIVHYLWYGSVHWIVRLTVNFTHCIGLESVGVYFGECYVFI